MFPAQLAVGVRSPQLSPVPCALLLLFGSSGFGLLVVPAVQPRVAFSEAARLVLTDLRL